MILLDIREYVMIASTQHQAWLFFLLAQQVALLKDDLLEAVDPLLDHPELIDFTAST